MSVAPAPVPAPARGMDLARLPARRARSELLGKAALAVCVAITVGALSGLMGLLVVEGIDEIDGRFLTQDASRRAERSGVFPAIVGTLWIGGVSMLFAIPVGIAAAVYLNEFARERRITSLLRASISNLAGVPSVVFGLLGLALFARFLGLGPSILTAGLTLGILTLPIIIVAAEEALKSVPRGVREAAFGLGASPWQVVRHHVLPYALPAMLTGSILALSRSIGETAPLIIIGAAALITFLPTSPTDAFTALPIQAYNWATKPGADFHQLTWAAVLLLVAITFLGNLVAIVLRDRFQRKIRW